MTRQEKEQLLLQLDGQLNDTLAGLNASDHIDNQLVEGHDVDAKYNDTEKYPQYGGDWRKYRNDLRAEASRLKDEIARVQAIEPEDPEPEPETPEE